MKRVLEIEGDVEKMLHYVFDTALKGAGMSVLGHINQLIQSIVQKEDVVTPTVEVLPNISKSS